MSERKDSAWTRFKAELLFRVLWLIATGIAASVRYKVEGWDKLKAVMSGGKGGLILPWHGVTILPIYYCRHMGFYSIVSLSKDGELQNKLLRSRGFRTIRGSSARQGVRALLEGIRCLQSGGIIAITPDGPKGPPKKVQAGTVHLAQKSGCPVLPVGVASSKCKRLHSWDSHLVPMPFSRATIVFGDPLYISADEDETAASERIEAAINAAELRAEELLSK